MATSARVFSSRDPRDEHIVKLNNSHGGTCTCGRFQNDFLPCKHAWAFLDHLRRDGSPYFASLHTRAAWLASYATPLPPELLSELVPDPTVLPPKTKVQLGRHEKKRKEAGTRVPTQCADPEPVQACASAGKRQCKGSGAWGGRWEYVVEPNESLASSASSVVPYRLRNAQQARGESAVYSMQTASSIGGEFWAL